MTYPNRSSMFLQDKRTFFKKLPTDMNLLTKNKINMQQKITHIEDKEKKEYSFLLQNQKILEEEFTQIFAVLKKQNDANKEAFWLYCYYCATLLASFYQSYSKKDKEKEYCKLKQEIKNRLLCVEEKTTVFEEKFIESLGKTFLDSILHLVKIPFHLSRIREKIAQIHISRIYWLFSHFTLTTALGLATNINLIDEIASNQIIVSLKAPIQVAYYLSVSLLLMRFAINSALLIRHTFFPSKAEKKNNVTAWERFNYELSKRQFHFVNDLVWASVNFITNFIIVNPTHALCMYGGPITVVFLAFDLGLLLYSAHREKKEYVAKKEQYIMEKAYYRNREKSGGFTETQREAHRDMLEKQIDELEINWHTKQATLKFLAAAAFLAMFGLALALIATPLAVPILALSIQLISYFMGLIGVTMFLSENAYAKYSEKNLRLKQAELCNVNKDEAFKEYNAASNHFIFSMIKKITIPTLLIATFAVCWPAAVALTVLYLGCELGSHAYNRYSNIKETASIALEKEQSKISTIKADVHEKKVEYDLQFAFTGYT